MKIKILSTDPDIPQLKFKVSNVDTAMANALRRIMIAETKCWAINTIDFYKNEGLMTMEEMGNRLGLLPVVADNENCSISFDGSFSENRTVLAKDLTYKNCRTVYPDMPITLLKKNQHLKFVCSLSYESKNSGFHAKWSPATVVFYKKNTLEGSKNLPESKENDEFFFTVETTGVVSPEDLVSEALDILEEKVTGC